ncbi:MAG: LPS assembly protein LptD [Verrucomicrobiaceae bacterium]|nr:LPS assembly protein LptD [Verrucomicrobiaceae bacterium]
MNFRRLCSVSLACCLLLGSKVHAQGILDSLQSSVVINGATTTIDPETGMVTYTGAVSVEYDDMQMRCNSASYNQVTGVVHATGGVLIWKDGTIYRGDSIDYNTITGVLSGSNVRSSLPAGQGSFYYAAKRFETDTKLLDHLEAEDVTFTMHDLADPNFRIQAREMNLQPEDKAELRDLKYYGGRTPLLWLPYVGQSINREAAFRFGPGYNSRWGAFMLTQYTVFHGTHTEARYKLDLRHRRGIAAGVDFFSMRHTPNRRNFGTLSLYALNDREPSLNVSGAPRQVVDNTRYKIGFQHRIYLPGPDVSTWYIDFDINKFSDVHFLEDFFFNDFRTNPEPDNQISLIKTDDRYVATLMTRLQLNKFYRSAERLPEFSLDTVRRPLFGSAIQYQSTTSLGMYNEKLGKYEEAELQRLAALGILGAPAVNADPAGAASLYAGLLGLPVGSVITPAQVTSGLGILNARLDEPGFARMHSYHEFLYPKTYFGWLNLIPRLGFGFTSYHSIDGSPTGLKNFSRGILHAGLEASFKLTRTWSDLRSEKWGLDGLRHVVRPYLNYSYLNAPMDKGLPGIDRLSATTRPRSIDPALFTAVDALRSWNVARVGVYNLLQTRRDYYTTDGYGSFSGLSDDSAGRTYTWAGMNTYVDLFAKDPEFSRSVSNLYNELFWRPVPWINVTSNVQLPLSSGQGSFWDVNHAITFLPSKNLSFQIGHQYLSDHPFFAQDSNLFFSRIHARLTENWGLSMNHIFEADDGTMEFQSYSLTRDLSSWLLSIGALVRDNRNGSSDFGVLFGFTLKEFPQLNFDLDIDPNPTGRGGSP